MSSVVLRGLTKRFGGHAALDNISLEIAHGQLVCLLGPSGCGKTTALRLVAGFIEPTAGEVIIGDRVVSSPARTLPPEQRNVSMVFQSYALWPHMTVAENVAYGLKVRKLARADIAKRVAGILATTQLATLADRYPAELSGGQQQRVSLARADRGARNAAARRAPVQPRRQPARGDALRGTPPARRLPLHHHLRHPRPERGHDDGRPDRRDERGRIEQLGTPQEVYDRPASEFVARFLGGSNILKGRALDTSTLEIAGAPLACNGAVFTTGAPGAASIRQHDIAISGAQPGESNALEARVVRNVFLGNARDYIVETRDGTQLRVTAPPGHNFATGTNVWLVLPAESCQALKA